MLKFCFLLFKTDTIEKEIRKIFNIPGEKETRLWNKYMSNTFEPLNKPDSTIQDAGLYQGQVLCNTIYFVAFLMFIFCLWSYICTQYIFHVFKRPNRNFFLNKQK